MIRCVHPVELRGCWHCYCFCLRLPPSLSPTRAEQTRDLDRVLGVRDWLVPLGAARVAAVSQGPHTWSSHDSRHPSRSCVRICPDRSVPRLAAHAHSRLQRSAPNHDSDTARVKCSFYLLCAFVLFCALWCVVVVVCSVLVLLDLPRQAAAHEGDLPPDQRAPIPVAADEVRHRRGHDPRGPLERLQPAVRHVRPGEEKYNKRQVDSLCLEGRQLLVVRAGGKRRVLGLVLLEQGLEVKKRLKRGRIVTGSR